MQLVNFWPVADLDRYLNVKHRVEARMALVDLSATQTDNLPNPGQIEDLIKEDLLFRDRQLKRLKDEVIDLEDLDDNVSLTSFSLDEFRLDLLAYIESRKDELEQAPPGLYAVVPPESKSAACQLGTLFCLRRTAKGGSTPADSQKLNPLAPHYLVYVHDDGTVRFSFAQPKECLLLLRDLCAQKESAIEKLCDLFDAKTKDGADMTQYDGLIQKTLASIERKRRATAALLSGRGGVLPTAAETRTLSPTTLNLVTWVRHP